MRKVIQDRLDLPVIHRVGAGLLAQSGFGEGHNCASALQHGLPLACTLLQCVFTRWNADDLIFKMPFLLIPPLGWHFESLCRRHLP